jgi:hypothetical protein
MGNKGVVRPALPRHIGWFAPWTWKRRRGIIGGMTVVAAAYPFSAGPVYWLTIRGWLPPIFFWYAYRPIWWLTANFDAIKRIVEAYLIRFST